MRKMVTLLDEAITLMESLRRFGTATNGLSASPWTGAAILLDCRSLSYRYLPFIAPELALLTINTGVCRELANSAYNE